MATPEDELGQESVGDLIRRRAEQLRSETLGQEAARSTLPPVFTGQEIREREEEKARRQQEVQESNRSIEALKKVLPIAAGRLNELLAGVSPATGFKEIFEIASSTEPGEVADVFKLLAQGDIEGSNEILGEILSRSPTAQRQQALRVARTTGVEASAREALLSLAELPAELIEALPEDFRNDTRLSDLSGGIFGLTKIAREDLRTFEANQDQLAMAFGASPEDIIGAKVVGGFVGYTPLLFGAFKAAEIFPFARGAGFRPFALRDLTAGSILGVAATEGDLKARFDAAKTEAAFFGAWSLGLAGLGFPLKAFRQRRLLQKLSDQELERLVRVVEESYDPNTGRLNLENLDGVTGRAVFQILSEEQALAQSSRGRKVLARTADERALVPALMDLAEGEASHGIIRGVKNPDDLVETLQGEFPNLSFEAVKRETTADIIFGRGKLGDTVMESFVRDGRVAGQRVLVGGQEMEYVGRGTEGRLRVKWLDSDQEIAGGVPESIVSDLPFANLGKPSRKMNSLVEEFADFFDRRINQVVRQREELTEEQVIQAAREGRLEELGLTLDSRRDYVADGVIGAPEAIGVRQPRMDPEEISRIIQEEGLETFHVGRPHEPATFRELVEQFARDRGLLEEEVVGLQFRGSVTRGNVQEAGEEVVEAMSGLEDEFLAVVVRTDDGARVTFARPGGGEVGSIQRGSLDEVTELLEGPLNANQTDAVTRLTGEAQQTVNALQAEAAKAVRQRMWQRIPKEERRLLTELREQVIRTLEDKGPSLQRDAALAGFNVRRLEGGRVELREVNTGLGAEFRNEAAAREALQGVERRLSNEVGRSLMPRFSDETPFTSHLPQADDFMLTGQEPPGAVLGALTENPKWINLQRWAQELEERTGLPLWSRVFEPLDEAQQRMNTAMEPWVKRTMAIWKDFSREERAALDPFWQAIAGKQLSQAQMIGIGQRMDLSGKQIRAALKALELERAMFQEMGLPNFRYLDNHFARIRPVIEDKGRLPQRVADIFDEDLPQRAELFLQKARTNELAQREMDPLLVQLKAIRAIQFDNHVRGPWERARAIIGSPGNPFNMDDLPEQQTKRLINFATGRQVTEDEGRRAAVRAHRVMKEYVGRARGFPSEGEKSANTFFKRLVDRLDLDIAPENLEQATDVMMSLMYGAAMGGRPRMTARNLSQNLWFSWIRLDGKHLGPSLRLASTAREAWEEATLAGATRPQQRGVFGGSAAFEGHMANLPEEAGVRKASNAVMRGLFTIGEAARKTARVGMVPFGSSDDFNRVWAYHAQKMHTEDWLRRLKKGEIDEAKFIEEGLRGHSATTKREFARRFDLLGEQEALQFIGKQHADEAHFIYARTAQPMWMQGDVGKFGGMFGTYSLWSKDYLFSLGRNMTPKQRIQAMAKGGAFGAAIFLVAEEMGFDLNNWLSPLSAFTFTGGPAVELADGVRDIVGNVTWAPERALGSARRVRDEGFRLAYPFQGLQHDIMQSGERAETLDRQVLSLILGRPERVPPDFWNDVMLPHEDGIITPVDQVKKNLGIRP